jgi:hypothetical protein
VLLLINIVEHPKPIVTPHRSQSLRAYTPGAGAADPWSGSQTGHSVGTQLVPAGGGYRPEGMVSDILFFIEMYGFEATALRMFGFRQMVCRLINSQC